MLIKTNGFLEEYQRQCKSGEIVVGLEMLTELDKLIADINGDEYIYDTDEADRRINLIEGLIKLTKSPFYGESFKLLLWQKAFISALYGFKMSDGLDRFKKVLLLVARKNGKSQLCSALALSEIIIGKSGSDVVCSSNDDAQASILYDEIETMKSFIDPQQRDLRRNQRFIKNTINNSKIFKLSDRTRSKEGRNIDVAIVDEIHEMTTNVIIKSIQQSQSLKENPKLILISTEGFVNDGQLDAELIYARKVLNGEEDGVAAKRFLPWLYTVDSENEVWRNRTSWVKANPTLGIVKRWDYMDEQVDLARQSKADRMFVLSKEFNLKVSNSQAWLDDNDFIYPIEKWQLEDFRSHYALAAVDLAETTDMSALKILLMRKDDDKKYIYSHYWIPESKLENSDDKSAGAKYDEWAREGLLTIVSGNDTDMAAIADHVANLYKTYDIRPFMTGYDQRFAKEFKNRMDDYGLEHEMILQNAETLNSAIKLVEAEFKDQLINYNANPIDVWCLRNASIKLDKYGKAILEKIKGQAQRRIDGAVALVILYEVYRRYRSELMRKLK